MIILGNFPNLKYIPSIIETLVDSSSKFLDSFFKIRGEINTDDYPREFFFPNLKYIPSIIETSVNSSTELEIKS